MHSLIHRFHFLSRFFSSPKQIGSVTPSSRFLVNALLEPISWTKINTIVELGAGTGVVTKEIERRKRVACQSVIFESDPKLSQLLQKKYPSMLMCSDAKYLRTELINLGVEKADCIISCLPFSNFSVDERLQILQEIKDGLSPNSLFLAYQYSLQMKPLFEHFFKQVKIRFIPLNIPPAFVYICN